MAKREAVVRQMGASEAGRAHRGNGPVAGHRSQRAEGRPVDAPSHVMIPGLADPVATVLPPALAALRDKALAIHQERGDRPFTTPELTLIDAAAWSTRADDEDWLVWRARRCAARLGRMPLEIERGERIVGRPRLRDADEFDQDRLAEAQRTLSTMPPFPGGDNGHFHPDFEKLFRIGLGGLLAEIGARRERASGDDAKVRFYDACRIAIEGMSAYIRRVGDACERMAERETAAAAPWLDLARICRRVSRDPPTTFHEAIQLLFATQVALWFGEDHYLTPPGRLDQTLLRFYRADRAAGRITAQEAVELLSCLFIQQNRILHTGSALSVLVGGRDGAGQDVTNELTYLCLAARLATRLSYPTVGIAWHAGTPAELTGFAVRMLAWGIGDPAFFNDEIIVSGLRDHGVCEADSHNYMNSTCVEIKVVGRSNIWVTSDYFNCPQALLDVMASVARGEQAEPDTFADLSELVRDRLATTARETAREKDRIWQGRKAHGGSPLASCLTLDCLDRGLDFDRGGARYNWVENSFVGLANLVDSLIVVRTLVYVQSELSLAQFYRIIERDFEENEFLRQRIRNTLPKYGNDLDGPNELAREWAEFTIETTEANTVGAHRYVPGFFCWVMHDHMGSQMCATPDGRRAGWPLADGAGAAQGRETRGPTASVLSTTCWSHRRALGGLVHNVKLSRRLLESDATRAALWGLIETYLERGGFEIQVNVVGRETLLDARDHPERYPDLLVRVAGYSDYFVKLSPTMQAEIIARTEHAL